MVGRQYAVSRAYIDLLQVIKKIEILVSVFETYMWTFNNYHQVPYYWSQSEQRPY